jgi:indolepyruvate ferredoxin oxidoreductase
MPDLSIKKQFAPIADEQHLMRYRLPGAQAYVRANGLDRVSWDSSRRELGIVTTGKSHGDVCQALKDLSIDESTAAALGLRVYKVAMVWPLEPQGLKDFASRHREVLFIEEKRPIMEEQGASILYNISADIRPVLSGKRDPEGAPLIPADGELSPAQIALIIAKRLQAIGSTTPEIEARSKAIERHLERSRKPAPSDGAVRSPAFCSGCPHNRSTQVPEGSVALAGIGCHTMAMWMPDRPTSPPTHMGGEGANWIGMAPFTEMQHVFQNMGDGTYFHSGLVAIRAAVASGVNVTYKILHNHVVAMTGGQEIDGHLGVPEIAGQVVAEGVKRVAIVSDDIDKYKRSGSLPTGVSLHHRDELIALETELRDVPGVSVLIYDQGCAADKRRRRKRGDYPDPDTRYYINQDVCEGCGDCSAKSTCVSISPVETELGRKRRIDQSSCNKDYSCVRGFCPSFITVKGGRLRKRSRGNGVPIDILPPPPSLPDLSQPHSMLVAGIGGTGVVTIGAVLGMAAHLEGKGCLLLDITGLAQKNGAVLSHVQFAISPEELTSARIGPGKCDLLLACDLIVGASPEAMTTLDADRTKTVANLKMTATAQFQFDPNMDLRARRFQNQLEGVLDPDQVSYVNASAGAEKLLGDSIGGNMFLVGFAYQKGYLPLSEDAILTALELNGVAVEMNKQAFQYGRVAAHEGEKFWDRVSIDIAQTAQTPTIALDDLINDRKARLIAYQNERYAEKYIAFVERVRERERQKFSGSQELTQSVAKGLYKLMAYKDEYEVARLLTSEKFQSDLSGEFEGQYKLQYNLAPPLLARKDPVTGEPKKMTFGGWIRPGLKLLARLKSLRGTPIDPFGWTSERRLERTQIDDYRQSIETVIAHLDEANFEHVLELARLPENIRGYGHVKEKSIAETAAKRTALLEAVSTPPAASVSAIV